MKSAQTVLAAVTLTLLLVLSFPGCTGLRQYDQPDVGTVIDVTDIEHQIHESINDYRSVRGLPPLRMEYSLTSVARTHSSAMATGHEPFSHNNATSRFSRIRDLFDAGRISENVAYSTHQPNLAGAIVDGWIRSDEHRKAILGPYSSTGIAVSLSPDGRYYVTQIFVAEKEQKLM